jgi:uncharacterized protein YuzE
MGNGRNSVKVFYDDSADLLYIRLDEKKQNIVNKRISEDVVLDIGEDERIIGIEILDASVNVKLENLLPIKYKISKRAV